MNDGTSQSAAELAWKPDWSRARHSLQRWWEGTGLALSVAAPKDQPWEQVPVPEPLPTLLERWTEPRYWVQKAIRGLAGTYFGGTALPILGTMIGGPGSLGLFLGCEGVPQENTVWYEPVISEPESHPPLTLDMENWWWKKHVEVIDEGLRRCNGRYLVGYPDLIENMDTLAQLRGAQTLMMDLIERPEWVKDRVAEINSAFFECFDALWPRLQDPWGGSAFSAFGLWGPGKTAKVQCDLACMIDENAFRSFVVPALAEQCQWLDYAMFHLDGTQARHQVPALLEIESLQAIEWTPQAGVPGGGSPEWYDLYRQIKAGGKSVQAIGVKPDEVEPLIDAVGPEGVWICTGTRTEQEARQLLERVGWPHT